MGIEPSFHVLCSQTRFRRYQGRRVQFSCFSLPDPLSTVPTAPGLIFMFCNIRPVFDGTEGVGSSFYPLCSRTHFRRYQGRQVHFSSFAHPIPFLMIPRASGQVFIFCTLGPVFDGTVDVRSRFHVLRFLTHYNPYRGRQVWFSYFALLDPFLLVPRVSGLIFIFCSKRIVFGGTEGVGFNFHVLRFRRRFRRYRGRRVLFSCTEVVGPSFHVLRSQTSFRRYRER
jgi:hypothetical protein